ncbi:Type VI secretion system protein, DotU-like [Desulfonema limicola]|uniref:Type VI secretion system protein, DotU-like n=1 Tax=Desulfonema limicola TaxID=45656 RepID=A0A975GHD1_9BACT|nr:DotU family type IV/VI secretion system protein [Desulfonema limicola]QTA81207.1 Type VI secretion system protein, DotU-like [Desulfonema limicola]
MKNTQWQSIHEVFSKMTELCGQLENMADQPYLKSLAPAPSGVSGDVNEKIVRVRADIRTHLEYLRVELAETLTEREAYLVLFPIVIYFDEMVQLKYLQAGQAWPSLQKELYQIDDGGVIFYETLDDILRKPNTLPFIYEVFYFCLNHGFKGKYNDDPVKISEYKNKLKTKLPVISTEKNAAFSDELLQIKTFGPPMWFYAGAAAIFGLCYFLIKVYAGNVKPI